jgi:glutathione S-transferase
MLFTVIGGQKSPAISAWKKKIGQRPAYQRAMARMRDEEAKQKKAKAKL